MKWRSEIASGHVRVLLLMLLFWDKSFAPKNSDECHLLWGDICGYVWGKTDQRLDVPIASERQRQTYYGAFDYHSKQFYLQAHDTGNTDNTIAFLKYLRSLDEQARLLIIWDGASKHIARTSCESFWRSVNTGLPPQEWNIKCFRFAPHAKRAKSS